MLSVAEARHLLGADCPMTDDEITTMLGQLSQIAFICLDTIEAEQQRSEPAARRSGP